MPSSSECFRFAERCVDIAEGKLVAREIFVQMAQAWLEVAQAFGPSRETAPTGNAPTSNSLQ
jgi:hypothetical protein